MDPEKVVKYGYVIKTEIITENTIWEVPGNAAVEKGVAVRIFGGGAGVGGSMGTKCGGGGGYMNNAILNLRKYEKVTINIGAGSSGAGGTTVFGGYLSANGGVTTGDLCDNRTLKQANGGIGGSGGGGGWWSNGGVGVQFGGGGGASSYNGNTTYASGKIGGYGKLTFNM